MKIVETANKATETKNGVNNQEVKAADAKTVTTASAKAKNGNGASSAPKANGTTVNKKADAPKANTKVVQSTKAELREKLAEQPPALSLDETIKLVEDLHRKKRQRDKLVETIDELQAFEIKQLDEDDAASNGSFHHCQLTIEDDKDGDFSTKNPFIINAVAQYVKALCLDKLAEIENEIYIPR